MADDLLGALTAVVAVATLPLGVLSLFFASWEVAMAVFVVGWFLLTPLIPIVGGELAPAIFDALGDSESSTGTTDPLTELKGRYARGEIDDDEFERQVGNLIETEGIDVDRDVDFDREQGADFDRERDVERARE